MLRPNSKLYILFSRKENYKKSTQLETISIDSIALQTCTEVVYFIARIRTYCNKTK